LEVELRTGKDPLFQAVYWQSDEVVHPYIPDKDNVLGGRRDHEVVLRAHISYDTDCSIAKYSLLWFEKT
jgi:hypothetical protein